MASYDHALTLQPDYAEALSNRGNTLRELKRFEEALASYDRALAAQPDHAQALSNRGNILRELDRFEEAWRATIARLPCSRILPKRSPIAALPCTNSGGLRKRWQATTMRWRCSPTSPRRCPIAAIRCRNSSGIDEALASYDRALAVRPDYAEALSNRGNTLAELEAV